MLPVSTATSHQRPSTITVTPAPFSEPTIFRSHLEEYATPACILAIGEEEFCPGMALLVFLLIVFTLYLLRMVSRRCCSTCPPTTSSDDGVKCSSVADATEKITATASQPTESPRSHTSSKSARSSKAAKSLTSPTASHGTPESSAMASKEVNCNKVDSPAVVAVDEESKVCKNRHWLRKDEKPKVVKELKGVGVGVSLRQSKGEREKVKGQKLEDKEEEELDGGVKVRVE